MNKIHTAEQLFNVIADELIWRKRELTNIKILLESTRIRDHQRDVLLRGGIALLYAHWEGFIKASATAYLNFVSTRKLKYEELSPNIVALSMKQRLRLAEESGRAIIHTDVADWFMNRIGEESVIPWDGSVITEANLTSKVLQDITCVVGVDFGEYTTKANVIDEQLVHARNTVAHGEYVIISLVEFLELREEVLGMMERFADQLENEAALEGFRRKEVGNKR